MTRRASYREGVEYVAMNDEPTLLDPEWLLGQPTIQLLSILFGKTDDQVAADVVRFRRKQMKEVRRPD